MNVSTWYEQAISKDAYQAKLTSHQASFEYIYEQFQLPQDVAFFNELEQKKLRVLVIAEPWCGHCMLNIPILLKLADRVGMPVRFALRDTHPDLMNHYLTNEKRVIPIFIFLNEVGESVGVWGPMAEYTKEIVDDAKSTLPNKESADYEEKFNELKVSLSNSFKERADIWQGAYRSIEETLEYI